METYRGQTDKNGTFLPVKTAGASSLIEAQSLPRVFLIQKITPNKSNSGLFTDPQHASERKRGVSSLVVIWERGGCMCVCVLAGSSCPIPCHAALAYLQADWQLLTAQWINEPSVSSPSPGFHMSTRVLFVCYGHINSGSAFCCADTHVHMYKHKTKHTTLILHPDILHTIRHRSLSVHESLFGWNLVQKKHNGTLTSITWKC